MWIFKLLKLVMVFILSNALLNVNNIREKITTLVNNNYMKFIKNEERNKIIKNINSNIDYFNELKIGIHINKKTLFISQLIIGIILCTIFFVKTKILFLSIVISIFIISLPIQYVIYKNHLFRKKFIQNLLILVLNLKNNVKNNNDIVFAIRKSQKNNLIKLYFNEFTNVINNGIDIIEAFEYIKNIFKIQVFSNMITVFQSCYLYGGNYYSILEKVEEQIKSNNKINKNFKQANSDMITTLIVMVIINVYLAISFILTNQTYIKLFTTTLIGKIIIDITLIIFINVYFVIMNINKMEE